MSSLTCVNTNSHGNHQFDPFPSHDKIHDLDDLFAGLIVKSPFESHLQHKICTAKGGKQMFLTRYVICVKSPFESRLQHKIRAYVVCKRWVSPNQKHGFCSFKEITWLDDLQAGSQLALNAGLDTGVETGTSPWF